MPTQATSKIVVGLALLALMLFNLFYKLPDTQLEQFDEARYVASAQEMLNSGHYLVNTYQGQPDYWLAKPPLPYWCAMLGRVLVSNPIAGMRLFSAIAAALTCLLVFSLARRVAGFYAGALAVALLLTMPSYLLDHGARNADADSLLMLFLYAALCAFLLPGRRGLIIGYLLGGAFMVKGMQVMPFALTAFVLSLYFRRRQGLSLASVLWTPLLFWLPVLPWALARYQYDGWQFFHVMFIVDVFQRYTRFLEGLVTDRTIYTSMYLECYGLVLLAVVLSLFFSRKWRPLLREPVFVQVFGWFLLPFLIFSISKTHFYWYSYPMLPALVTVLACLLVKMVVDLPLPALSAVALLCCFGVVHAEEDIAAHVSHGDMGFKAGTAAITRLSLQTPVGVTVPVYLEFNYRGDVAQRDYATALLLGNIHTLPGGKAAFRQSTDPQSVYIDKDGNITRH